MDRLRLGETRAGEAVSIAFTACQHGEKTGGIVAFGDCEGCVSWCVECDRQRWELHSLDPLHLEPSIQCQRHPEHHGFIRGGKWEPA